MLMVLGCRLPSCFVANLKLLLWGVKPHIVLYKTYKNFTNLSVVRSTSIVYIGGCCNSGPIQHLFIANNIVAQKLCTPKITKTNTFLNFNYKILTN